MVKKNTPLTKTDSAIRKVSSVRKQFAAHDITRDKRYICFRHQPVCERFDIGGIAISHDGTPRGIWCTRILADGQRLRMCLPFESLQDKKELARKLLELHIVVPPDSRAIRSIAAYIHILSQRATVRVFEREGIEWVMEDNKTYPVAILSEHLIAPAETQIQAEILLQEPSIYAKRGKYSDWVAQAKAMLPGNLLAIAVCGAALSAPFKQLFRLPLCSMLLVAPSSSGKTTLARFANSLFGPAGMTHSWAGTANAIEALALRHTDAPLVLDEMAEGRAIDVLNVIYRINNGTQKARAKADGSLQPIRELRSPLIACSEVSLTELARTSRQAVMNGHEVRMLTIIANEPYGCFGSLNGFPDAAALVHAMGKLANECYGHVWPMFIRALIDRHDQYARLIEKHRCKYRTAIAAGHEASLSPVEARALDGCVTWALAAEIAIRGGVLPLEEGTALAAVTHVFASWLYDWRNRAGTPEPVIVQHFRDFFQRYGSSLFGPLKDWKKPQHQGRLGYRHFSKNHGEIFLLQKGFFEQGLCKHFTVGEALSALKNAGLLVTHRRENTKLQRMPGAGPDEKRSRMRFYALKNAILFDD